MKKIFLTKIIGKEYKTISNTEKKSVLNRRSIFKKKIKNEKITLKI